VEKIGTTPKYQLNSLSNQKDTGVENQKFFFSPKITGSQYSFSIKKNTKKNYNINSKPFSL